MKIIENYKNISSSYLIDSENKWKNISIFWWIHWDEKSWILACKKFLKNVDDWEIEILKWKIILVLKSNEEAVKINKREVKFNLNRLFKDNSDIENCYEKNRAEELKTILQESDYLLDLHSTSWPSIPFLFSEMPNFDLAKKLWVNHIIAWWNELWWVISWDTESYINSLWWQWFTFEAWNYDNPDWEKIAYQMLLNFLSQLWIISNKYFKNILELEEKFIKMKSVYIAKSNNFKYKIDIENFKEIKKWTLIWIDNWEKIFAEEDIFLIMPKKEEIIEKWVEVFFIWNK